MQSRALLTALFVFAASSVTEAQDSTNDASTTASSSFDPDAQLVSIVNASLNSYQATITTDPKYIAIDEYLSTAPTDFATEFSKENDAYFGQFPTTGSVELPAHITALPSSLQSYASKVLQDEGNIIDEVVSANVGGESSATEKSSSATGITRSSTSSNDTQTGSSTNTSGAGPDNTSGVSGSLTTKAPTGSGSSASRSSSSSSTGNNAEAQPTAALKVMGALAVGVIGLVAVA